MTVLSTLVVTDDKPVPQSVSDCKVWVFDKDDMYVTEDYTDLDGEVGFMLAGAVSPGERYIIRLMKDGWSFPAGHTQTIDVIEPIAPPQTNVFDFIAHERVLTESNDPSFCCISGYLTDVSGRPWAGRTVVFHQRWGFPDNQIGFPFPGEPSVVGRRVIVADRAVQTDEDGYLEVALPRKGVYDVHVYGLEDPANIISPIYVPDALAWKLEDVMFPTILQLSYGTNPVDIAVGGSVDVSLTALFSNGLEDSEFPSMGSLIVFTSENESVATVAVVGTALRVSGLSVGTTNIVATRREGSFAPRMDPAVPDLVVVNLVVTVN